MNPPLEYAARPPIDKSSSVIVVLIGLLTTAAALLGVWYIGKKYEQDVMLWYLDYVLPAGALIVGIVAGSGYGVGSWWTGLRISGTILVSVLILQFAAYWVAQYLAFEVQHLVYTATQQPIGFFDYYHLTTVTMIWKSADAHPADGSSAAPEPLGMWGYGLRAMELIGFIGGTLIILLILRAKPYCETCRIYMRSRKLPTLPASVKARTVKRSNAAALAEYNTEQQQAADGGAALLGQMSGAATAGDVETFNKIVEAARPSKRAAEKLPRRITLSLIYCRNCFNGHLGPAVVTGRGKKIKTTRLAEVPVPESFVRGFVGAPAGATAAATIASTTGTQSA